MYGWKRGGYLGVEVHTWEQVKACGSGAGALWPPQQWLQAAEQVLVLDLVAPVVLWSWSRPRRRFAAAVMWVPLSAWRPTTDRLQDTAAPGQIQRGPPWQQRR